MDMRVTDTRGCRGAVMGSGAAKPTSTSACRGVGSVQLASRVVGSKRAPEPTANNPFRAQTYRHSNAWCQICASFV